MGKRFEAAFADTKDGPVTKAMLVKDERFIIADKIRADTLRITTMTTRYQIQWVIVVAITIQMVSNQGVTTGAKAGSPVNNLRAPVALMGAKADALKQNHPVDRNLISGFPYRTVSNETSVSIQGHGAHCITNSDLEH